MSEYETLEHDLEVTHDDEVTRGIGQYKSESNTVV